MISSAVWRFLPIRPAPCSIRIYMPDRYEGVRSAERGADQRIRTAAARARTILRSWQGKQRPKSEQMGLFAEDEEKPA
jgi:hypothetical protein